MKLMIIEDEAPARQLLQSYLLEYPNIEIIGICEDGFAGVKSINELRPDIILLDIQMPRLTGFEVLELCEHKPQVIFTTAFDAFAIKAFEMNATDYLLKPFSKARFCQAMNKVIEICQSGNNQSETVSNLVQYINQKTELLERIAIRTGSKIHVINTDEILYLQSDDDYVNIHTEKATFLKDKTMKYFEEHLDSTQFIRIHRSHIVNIHWISKLELYSKDSYIAVLKNGEHLKISDTGYRKLKLALNL